MLVATSVRSGGGMQTYHLYDGLGSTTDLTDGSGNVTAGYGYDVFGTIHSRIGRPAVAFQRLERTIGRLRS
jgi:hypothetical protein